MTARTFKFIGKVYADAGQATVTAELNGVEIYSGLVPTTNQSRPDYFILESDFQNADELFRCDVDSETTGVVPLKLSITGGHMYFGLVYANWNFMEYQYRIETSESAEPRLVIDKLPEDSWGDVNINSVESDGKTDIVIDGIEHFRQVTGPSEIGDWWYEIPDNGMFTCNLFVDPVLVVNLQEIQNKQQRELQAALIKYQEQTQSPE